MTMFLQHPDGQVEITELPGGKRRITIHSEKVTLPVIDQRIDTAYPVELIEAFLNVKGIRSLTDEIRREQDPYYTRICLEKEITAYLDPTDCKNKRILDFGCGSGASGIILARMFPDADIVGIDLDPKLVSLAQHRAAFYGMKNLHFQTSPSGDTFPEQLGSFDIIMLSAVFEHLLPDERPVVLRQIWNHLNPGGILFLNQTPYRWFPFEGHTTHLPLLNYLPDKLAHTMACRFSRRVAPHETWENLLRRGIRGTTPRQILRLLQHGGPAHPPKILTPSQPGFRDRIDVWYAGYAVSIARKYPKAAPVQKILRIVAKGIYRLTGIVLLPTLALAIQKR